MRDEEPAGHCSLEDLVLLSRVVPSTGMIPIYTRPQRTLTDEKSDQALRKRVEGWYQHTLDCMERLKEKNSGKELLTPEFTNHMSNASILKKILEVKDE